MQHYAIGIHTLPTQPARNKREHPVSTYRMTYGDAAGKQVNETFEGVEVEREDGWVVLFRGTEAILRLQEEHVLSLEEVPTPPAGP